MGITVKQEGRRYYLEGAGYEQREWLKTNNCRWDMASKRWWTGIAAKADQLFGDQYLVTKAKPDPRDLERELTPDTKIMGMCMYRGRQYLLVWHGVTTYHVSMAKLAFLSGKQIFWVRFDQVVITKLFPSAYGVSTSRNDPLTFGMLLKLFEETRKHKAALAASRRRFPGGVIPSAMGGTFSGVVSLRKPPFLAPGVPYYCNECDEVAIADAGDICPKTGTAH